MRSKSPAMAGAGAIDRCTLHDPIFLDHFPYLLFPTHWPLYTSKDKIADWMELYAQGHGARYLGQHALHVGALR